MPTVQTQNTNARNIVVIGAGGVFLFKDQLMSAAIDRLSGDMFVSQDDPGFRRYMDEGHLKFTMATARETDVRSSNEVFADHSNGIRLRIASV